MSPRSRLWTACASCRSLPLRSRTPVATPIRVLAAPGARTNSTSRQRGADGQVRGARNDGLAGMEAEEVEDESAVRRDLNNIIMHDEAEGIQQQGQLSRAQRETLYSQGFIPSAEQGAGNEAKGPYAPEYLEDPENARHKFPIPRLKPGAHLKFRYHPVLHQLTNLLMQHGKLATARRHMSCALNFLRSSPPPTLSPKYPLVRGAPPPNLFPLNPILYLTVAVDSVAPLIRIQKYKGMAGGGKALEVPKPITLRARRRAGFMWILGIAANKPSRGSGKKQFGYRLAEEIIAVVEGRSSAWEKRTLLHRAGIVSRANLKLLEIRQRR